MKRFALVIFPSAAIVAALVLASSHAEAQETHETQETTSAMVVPVGIGSVDGASVAAMLTTATAELFAETGAKVDLAKAPLVDILTLIECPTATDECVGSVAEVLGVDVVMLGVVNDTATQIDVAIVKRDKSVDRFTHLLGGGDALVVETRYRRALAARLGLPLPALPPVAAASPPPTTVTLAPLEASAPIAEPRPIESDSRAGFSNVRPLSWVALGIGVVSLGFGGIFYSEAQSTEDAVANAPSRTESDLVALRELEDQGDREKTMSGVFLTVGAVATVAGIGLIVWDSTRPEARGTMAIAATIAPTDSSGGLSVSISGGF